MAITVDRHLPTGCIGRDPVSHIRAALPCDAQPHPFSLSIDDVDGETVSEKCDGELHAIVTFTPMVSEDFWVLSRYMAFPVRGTRWGLVGAACCSSNMAREARLRFKHDRGL